MYNNASISQNLTFYENFKKVQQTKLNRIKTLKIYDNYDSKRQLRSFAEYDQNGNETYNVTYNNDSSISSEEKWYYDAQFRAVKSETKDYYNNYITSITFEYHGNDVLPYKQTELRDANLKETYFYFNNALMTKYVTGNLEYIFEYDEIGRIKTRHFFAGYKASYYYDKNRLVIENNMPKAKWRTSEHIYNESGLLVEHRQFDNDKRLISYSFYTYDNNGNLIYSDHGINENSTSRTEYVYEFYEVQNNVSEITQTYDYAQKAFNDGDYAQAVDLLKDFPETSSLYDDAVALMLKALEKLKANKDLNFVSVYGQIGNLGNINVSGFVIFEDLLTGSQVGKCRISKNGYYYIILPSGKKYSYYIDVPGFYPLSRIADFTTPAQGLVLNDNITLISLDEMTEQQLYIRINNIFFDYNESTLKPESFLELDRLYNVLNSNPGIKVEISGHTDNVGSDEYNNILSQSRSESVKDYLVKKGINAGRIISKGYGKSNPVATNDTEEGRQLNRRVEFKILKK